jgi:hypothetical protein
MNPQLPNIEGTLDDDAYTFRAVPTKDLRETWPLLQYGLEEVRRSNGEVWIAEDVYASLLYGQATLYLIHDAEGILQGFGIFKVFHFDYDFEPTLLVWIGWSKYRRNGHLGRELTRKIKRAAGINRAVYSTTQENPWVLKDRKLHTWYEIE